MLINEYFNCSKEVILHLITDLFNLILQKGIVPNEWGIGIIKPIYKNKGDRSNPEFYRGITLLSCLGKLFTAVLNKRLTDYLEKNDIIGEEQAGFRKDYNKIDHIFVLKSITELYLNQNKKLFCLFVDYSTAFDKINRRLQNVRSCIDYNGVLSDFFDSNIGLRQGENLSPLLYTIFINDLSSKLGTNTTGLSYLNNLAQNMDITTCNIYSKLFLLLYADDTVILAENQSELQKTLENLHEYCITNELAINTTKTRVMVCSCGKIRNKPTFTYGVNKLEIVFEYMYLGVKVTYNGSPMYRL